MSFSHAMRGEFLSAGHAGRRVRNVESQQRRDKDFDQRSAQSAEGRRRFVFPAAKIRRRFFAANKEIPGGASEAATCTCIRAQPWQTKKYPCAFHTNIRHSRLQVTCLKLKPQTKKHHDGHHNVIPGSKHQDSAPSCELSRLSGDSSCVIELSGAVFDSKCAICNDFRDEQFCGIYLLVNEHIPGLRPRSENGNIRLLITGIPKYRHGENVSFNPFQHVCYERDHVLHPRSEEKPLERNMTWLGGWLIVENAAA